MQNFTIPPSHPPFLLRWKGGPMKILQPPSWLRPKGFSNGIAARGKIVLSRELSVEIRKGSLKRMISWVRLGSVSLT